MTASTSFTPEQEVERGRASVARGIALLDEKVPNWVESINWEILDIELCGDCIVGQIGGEYIRGLRVLGVIDDNYRPTSLTPPDYGFEVYPDSALTYDWLTREWKAVATDRLKSKKGKED